jgi:hypothetical protein
VDGAAGALDVQAASNVQISRSGAPLLWLKLVDGRLIDGATARKLTEALPARYRVDLETDRADSAVLWRNSRGRAARLLNAPQLGDLERPGERR